MQSFQQIRLGRQICWPHSPNPLKALESCNGGAFILDEAYSLLNISDTACTFGLKALNAINQYSLGHPLNQKVIFCGYRDMIKGLYENQRGLYCRFNWYTISKIIPQRVIHYLYDQPPPNSNGPHCATHRFALQRAFLPLLKQCRPHCQPKHLTEI